MPANLTPQYQKAEEAYRRATTAVDRLTNLELMLQLIPKHKGTEKLQADIKSRIKETRSEQEAEKKSGGRKGPSYRFPRQGAGQIVLLGAPNGGKSLILQSLTKAHPHVADFPFATHEPLPGMMDWNDTAAQLIDTPPITDTHFEPYLVNIVRAADLVGLVFNGQSDDAAAETMTVIRHFSDRKTLLSDRTGFDENDFSVVHVKTLLLITHADDPDVDLRLEFLDEMGAPTFPRVRVELTCPDSVERLREDLYAALDVIRAYTKRPGKPAEYIDPFTLPNGSTVEDLAHLVHREQAEKLKFAKVWGTSVVDGQSVGREHLLADRDMVELHW